MVRDEYIAHLARDGQRLGDLAHANLDAPVPTCPDWTLRDLLVHTGNVHRWFTLASREQTAGPPDFPSCEPDSDEGLPRWIGDGVAELADVFGKLDADTPRWTWFEPNQSAGWYFRRAAHETLIHRIDAERAVGAVTRVDTPLAIDGIDEICDVFIPSSEGQVIGGDGSTLHLHATDAHGEWLLTLHPNRIAVTRGHADAEAELRGTARDLLLMAWGRDPLGPVQHRGNETVIATFSSATKID